MKLYGEVEIRNMLVSSANIRPNKKTSKACISIGKKSLKDSAGSLLICTHSNKSGVNYKVYKLLLFLHLLKAQKMLSCMFKISAIYLINCH